MIKLGERIKEFRQRDGRTQDALAEELGVTAQAVSRWEKGICYPDMEVIPSIANYFNVSIDVLFGYDHERSKRADALARQINEMIRLNNGKDVSMDECIALAREALIEFPGNEKLTLALASALFTAGYVRYGEHHVEGDDGYSVYDVVRHREYMEWKEAIRLYEKLLLSLNSGEMRQQAVIELSQLYKNTGEHEKALLLAQSAPDINATRLMLRINAFDGKEEVAASGEALLDMIMRSTELIESIVRTDIHMQPNTAAEMIKNATMMFDLVYTDHFYGKSSAWLACLNMLRSYYLWLAGEKDSAFEALDLALSHATAYDKLRETSPEFFASPLLRHVKTNAGSMSAQSGFKEELPEVWPWWCVSKCKIVKEEMQTDSRWDEWVRKTKA
jgi:transcriptional regulator with XRE-family HTH domain